MGFLERSTGIAITRFLRSGDSIELNQAGTDRREIVRSSRSLGMMIRAAARLAADRPDQEPRLRGRTFESAQWAHWSEAAASLAQMAARQAKGEGALARLVRERQDLAGEWQAKDKALLLSRAEPPERRNREAETALATRLGSIDSRIAEIDRTLAKEFPEFATLTISEAAVGEQVAHGAAKRFGAANRGIRFEFCERLGGKFDGGVGTNRPM
jgi:hypothetical protein